MKGAEGDYKVLWLALTLWGLASIPLSVHYLLRDGMDPRGILPLGVSVVAHSWYSVMLASAYRTGEISTAYPIARGLGAAGTAVFGYLILREGFSRAGVAGILLVITGILLIGKGGIASGIGGRALLFAVLTGAGIMSYSGADKIASSHIHPFAYLCFLNLGNSILTSPLAFREGAAGLAASLRANRLRILLISVGRGLPYLLILWVYQVERAGYIAVVRESSVVVAVLLGRFFLNEKIDRWKTAGIVAVVGGLALIRLG